MLKIYCKNTGTSKEFQEGVSLAEVLPQFEFDRPYDILCAKVNYVTQGMKYRAFNNRDVEFLDYRSYAGRSAYCRSLCFLLSKAAHDVFPDSKIKMRRPISKGYFCDLQKGSPVTSEDVERIRERMLEIVAADSAFKRMEVRTDDAIALFRSLGYDDKMEAWSPHHSAIYDVDKSVDGKSCIVCTGYGEVLRWRGGKVETLFFDKRYDLRSMVQEPDAVWTLSFDGHLLHISATGKQQQMEDFVLPEGEYFHLQDLPEGRLLAGARHQVVIFDIKTRSILTVRPFPGKRLLTTMPTKKEVFFFYDNATMGRTPYSTKQNSEVPSPIKEPITAAHYDETSNLAYVGCQSGRIYVLKEGGIIYTRLLGHSSAITDFTFMPEQHLMLSTGRDKELHIWDVRRIRAGKPVESTRHRMDSWPLSLAPIGSRVVCGLVNGKLIMWEFDVDKLAQATRNRINSGLNENEWNTFVGAKVDYVKLK